MNPNIIEDAEIFRSDGDRGTVELIGILGAEAKGTIGNMIPYETTHIRLRRVSVRKLIYSGRHRSGFLRHEHESGESGIGMGCIFVLRILRLMMISKMNN